MVLGAGKDLAVLIKRHRINRLILTATLAPEMHGAVQELAAGLGFRLSEWKCAERDLAPGLTRNESAAEPIVNLMSENER